MRLLYSEILRKRNNEEKKMEVTPSNSKTPDPRGGGHKKLGAGGRGKDKDAPLQIRESLPEIQREEGREGDGGDNEEPQHQLKPRKEKKLAQPRVTGLHIPRKDNIIPARDDGLPHGIPEDGGNVLIGYAESWSKRIYETPDHNDVVRVLRHHREAEWKLSEEVPEVVAYVQSSSLWLLTEHGHKECDRVTISAFSERFCPKTYTFHLTVGEMTITPDDANKITWLKVRGRSVDADYYDMSWAELYNLYHEFFVWNDYKTKLEFFRSIKDIDFVHEDGVTNKKLKKIKLTNLRDKFGDTKEKVKSGRW
ncbi:uncharacterized protein LOC113309282 isoform X2 [Papaver somniferum]|uniref:uncharacterized protein LOC113309282 isoform X2 n=1 Tax=Papaver somniferum TaxID=3469 RepID=UPI000E6F9C52|nr:uncharacterized protein LOC113309282 isoform X2 [Papaver somniferum]